MKTNTAPITQRAVAENEAERIAGYRAGIDRPVEKDPMPTPEQIAAYCAYIAAHVAHAKR